ncbi:MAG: decaprenyl-phosphate phosphoribosyltransferase [Candidatus Helarchaeota archaeon]|nr:decaprenyl-phosphate phosphoribosyltransferase [Candidatus Helarchaeota archaeon]
MKYIILSMRPDQWIKNLLVLAPLIFSKNIHFIANDIKVLAAVILFILISGCVYMSNDIFDLENDKNHPVKSKRPLSSGKIKKSRLIHAIIVLSVITFISAYKINFAFGNIILGYFLLNFLYSTYLKRIVILDVMVVALGFYLRILAGGVVIDVYPSVWLSLCTILLSLFLVFSKRRHELVVLENRSNMHREVLSYYSPYFIDQMISIVTALTIITYIMYTISDKAIEYFGNRNLIYTNIFVFYGIFRYLYLVYKEKKGGDPVKIILSDKFLLINILLWAISVYIIIY